MVIAGTSAAPDGQMGMVGRSAAAASDGNETLIAGIGVALPLSGHLLSAELAAWLAKCPDRSGLCAALKDHAWQVARHKCGGCGDEFARRWLRFDITTPPSDQDKLICSDCCDKIAEEYKDGTVGDPSYRVPAWPASASQDHVPAPKLEHGSIIDRKTNKPIGIVRGYNERSHFADLVSLFALPGCQEPGSLDPGYFVVPLPDAS
jgi:hypothetical protein